MHSNTLAAVAVTLLTGFSLVSGATVGMITNMEVKVSDPTSELR